MSGSRYAYHVTHMSLIQLAHTRTPSQPCERNRTHVAEPKTGVLVSSREFFILLYGCVFALLFHTRDSVDCFVAVVCISLLASYSPFSCVSLAAECEKSNKLFLMEEKIVFFRNEMNN